MKKYSKDNIKNLVSLVREIRNNSIKNKMHPTCRASIGIKPLSLTCENQ